MASPEKLSERTNELLARSARLHAAGESLRRSMEGLQVGLTRAEMALEQMFVESRVRAQRKGDTDGR